MTTVLLINGSLRRLDQWRGSTQAQARRDLIGSDGTVNDPTAREAIRAAVHALVEHVSRVIAKT